MWSRNVHFRDNRPRHRGMFGCGAVPVPDKHRPPSKALCHCAEGQMAKCIWGIWDMWYVRLAAAAGCKLRADGAL